MIKKDKVQQFVEEFQPQLTHYWKDVSLDDIISIKTKKVETPYLTREAEQFMALQLPQREIPGFGPRDIRYIRFDDKEFQIRNLPENWVDTVNGKPYAIPTHWVIDGSKGNKYDVNRSGDHWTCSCASFKYRKGECKHIKGVRNEITI